MDGHRKLRTGFLLFPGLTQLDFTGPYEVLARVPELEIFTIAERAGPVQSEFGLSIVAEHDFSSTPQLDIICVPGGPGTLEAAAHLEVIAFLQAQARGVQWLTSVCTGSLLLGAAGLLKGYRATTHWLSLDLLPLVGAIPVQDRVVKDRNRITGGGITAGIDLALTLTAELFGRERAEAIELVMEYNPAPPFGCGHPSLADPSLVQAVREERRGLQAQRREFLASLKIDQCEAR
jgi:cyclohexyl-isocyanide hydratase